MTKCLGCEKEIKTGELCCSCLSKQIAQKIPLINIIPIPNLDPEEVEKWLIETGWLEKKDEER